mmetsp:Transcript_36979/g.56654  ORF Transcript_36979/g.56654 Transcript_36979/m.56654 type:complete len:91 (+) Transcript_36979:534-806(+)
MLSRQKIRENCDALKKWVFYLGLQYAIVSTAFIESNLRLKGWAFGLTIIVLVVDYLIVAIGARSYLKKDILYIPEAMILLQARHLLQMLT